MSVQEETFRLLAVAMESYASAYIMCGVLAVVVYKIISAYVRKSILAKGSAVEGQDNKARVWCCAEENVSEDVGEKKDGEEKSTKGATNNNGVGGISRNGLDPGIIPMGKEDLASKCEHCETTEDSGGSDSRHKTKKSDSCVEQFHVVDLLQAGITANELDTLQPPIEVCEWFACRYQCAHTTYDLKVTLQDERQQPIVEFYYGYDFSQSPKGIWKKVSNTFKKYGPGIRFINFRHKVGKDVEINDGRYDCKMSDGVITVARNKMT